jgi:hypothetical protein
MGMQQKPSVASAAATEGLCLLGLPGLMAGVASKTPGIEPQ